MVTYLVPNVLTHETAGRPWPTHAYSSLYSTAEQSRIADSDATNA